MADDNAKSLLRRKERLASDRGTWEQHWQEIAELFSPFRADFQQRVTVAGEKRTQKIFDGTPGMAAENLAAGLWGMLTNSANAWFELAPADDDLADDQDVKLWAEEARDVMLAAFADNGQRFYSRVVDLYSDVVHFGTAIFYVEETDRNDLFFSCRHLAECYIAENQYEQVDTVLRSFRWTARQAVQRWGDRVGSKVREKAEKTPDQPMEFLHAVVPVADYDGEIKQPAGVDWQYRWASVYIGVDDCNVLSESGYVEFPFMVPRWSQRSRSVYGDSPAMIALADAKMLNQMSRTTIVGAQKQVDPPLLAPDEASVRGIRTTPGGVIYGGMDPQGRRLYGALETGGQLGLGLEMEEQRRNAIRDALYAPLLLMVNQPGRTATEVLALQEEKMRLMGPHLGRLQSEFLEPLISRVFGILMRSRRIPEPPPVLAEAPALEIKYVSPMARAQRASEATAVVRTLEVAGALAQGMPEVMDGFDIDEAMRVVADANGMPATVLRSEDDIEAMRAERIKQQNMAAAAQAAPGVAQAAKQGAEAVQIAQGQR